jgi:trehalose utilization protein
MFPAPFTRGRLLALCLACLIGPGALRAADPRVRILVWDEQQPAQRHAYSNFLGNEIVAALSKRPGLDVRSANLGEPAQGLDPAVLDRTDVLVWWGHVRNREVPAETGRAIVQRIKAGRLSLVALHSAHWSTPFVEAMRERSRDDARRALPESERATAVLVETNRYPGIYTPPKPDDLRTPATWYRKPFDGPVEITLALPNCCFPAYRPDAMPSRVRVLKPHHPIARGLPAEFQIPNTEMYCEPFHVPPPDEVVFEEHWAPGEWFRSGCVWSLGKGKVFYFRPGHELYPVFKEATCLRVLENAARWLAKEQSGR